jgi:hypothetical protein
MLTLLGAVGLVLLIACSECGEFTLAHGPTRARELTMRGTLGVGGASSGSFFREFAVIDRRHALAAGGVVGRSAARRSRQVAPGSRTSVLTVASSPPRITLFTSVLCGLIPALRNSRLDFVRALKENAVNTGAAGRRIRNGLVIVEVALAVMLLVGAGLFIGSFARLLNVDQGFDPSGVMSVGISAPRSETVGPNSYRPQMLSMLAAIRAVPGIEAAAAESAGPYEGGYSSFPITVPGRPAPGPNSEPDMIRFSKVSAGFLEMLHVPLRAGRGFTREDASGAPVALINELAARRFWGDANPIGQPLTIQGTPFQIVGVVGNVHYAGPAAALAPEAFLPFEQTARGFATFIFRGPATQVPAIKAAIWSVNPALPISQLLTAEATFERVTATRRFNMFLMGIFAALRWPSP